MIFLLELLTVLLEYIYLSVIAILISKNSYYYTNILPIMPALCSMLSDTYYAHSYASIIGGSLYVTTFYKTDPNRTSGKIKLTPQVDSYTIVLLLTLSTTQTA